MRPVVEFLEELEEPYRSQALKNFEDQRTLDEDEYLDVNAYEALHGAFHWGATPEGHDYWNDFSKTLE